MEGRRHRCARPVAGKDVRHQRPCERINETATDSQAGRVGGALHRASSTNRSESHGWDNQNCFFSGRNLWGEEPDALVVHVRVREG